PTVASFSESPSRPRTRLPTVRCSLCATGASLPTCGLPAPQARAAVCRRAARFAANARCARSLLLRPRALWPAGRGDDLGSRRYLGLLLLSPVVLAATAFGACWGGRLLGGLENVRGPAFCLWGAHASTAIVRQTRRPEREP